MSEVCWCGENLPEPAGPGAATKVLPAGTRRPGHLRPVDTGPIVAVQSESNSLETWEDGGNQKELRERRSASPLPAILRIADQDQSYTTSLEH